MAAAADTGHAAGGDGPARVSSLQQRGVQTVTAAIDIPDHLRVPGLATRAVILQQLDGDGHLLRAQLCINANLGYMQDLAAESPVMDEQLRTKRRRKEPNAPRKPLTAYLVFTSRHRAQVLADNPGITSQKLTSLLAYMWNKVSDAERQDCQQVADGDRERYNAEMAAYRLSQLEGVAPGAGAAAAAGEDLGKQEPLVDGAQREPQAPQGGKKRKPRGPKDPAAPAKARSAYVLFSIDARRRLPEGVNFSEGTRIIAEEWRAADPDTRDHYQALADAERDDRHALLTSQPELAPKQADPSDTAAEMAAEMPGDAAEQAGAGASASTGAAADAAC